MTENASNAPLLELKDVDTFYGPAQVHFGLSLTVPRGHIVCLLGGNASGKSTTMKVILGLVQPRAGDVAVRRRLHARRADAAARAARSRLGARGAPALPGHERARERADGRLRAQRQAEVARDLDRVLTLFPRLGERLQQRAGSLSGGEQQMVAMARALMSRPRLIVMDEPTMGLSPLYVDRVLELIQTINGEGVSIFMVEQNATLALEIAHDAYVLQTGRIVLSGPARDLRNDPRIRDAYLGGAEAA